MKLQEYINDMKPDFHKIYGNKYQFERVQSEAHVDLTLSAATQYVQKLVMSGKINDIKDLATQGSMALLDSPHYKELMQEVIRSYYGLNWNAERKEALAKDVLGFILDGLKHRFQAGGYSMDQKGLMSFLGIDLGLLGKMGGMFSKFFR
jgi:hypothetical protein